MSSDDAYSAFLDQANQSTSKPKAQSKSSGFPSTQAVSEGEQVPAALQRLDVQYISETEEPFEAVALKWAGGELNGDNLAKAIGHHSAAEKISLKQFDSRGDYNAVVEAVRAESDDAIAAFRVQGSGARVEYWLVGLQGKQRLVGTRARAVES